jgi:hypothetical protein
VTKTLPLKQLLTHSSMSTMRTCPRKFMYRYEIGLRPERDTEALRVGTMVHDGIEALMLGAGAAKPVALTYEQAIAYELVSHYDWFWGNCDAPDNIRVANVLAAEREFVAALTNPETGKASRTWNVAGKIDAIVELGDGRVAVMEHKTTSEDIQNPTADYWARLRLDQQISLYVIAARNMGFDVSTVLYNVIRKPGIRPLKATPEASRKYKADGTLYANQRAADESVDEYAARLAEYIQEDPTSIFQRREIPRLEDDLNEFAAELWAQGRNIADCRTSKMWVRNTAACVGFSPCEYLPICHQRIDASSVPGGFKIIENVHSELKGA